MKKIQPFFGSFQPFFASRKEVRGTSPFFGWLVVSNMAGLFSISYMGCHPSHRLSYFSRWLLHHQPVGNDFLNDGESSFGSDVHTFWNVI